MPESIAQTSGGVNVSELIARVDIRKIYEALGGPKLRGTRGPAFWRGGDGLSVSLNDAKNTWFDHAGGEGGGVIALIQRVLDCSKVEAVTWLADYLGVVLPASDSPAGRARAARLKDARAEAERLVEWRDTMLAALRGERTRLLEINARARRFLFANPEDDCLRAGGLRLFKLEAAWEIELTYEPRIAKLDEAIRTIGQADFARLLPHFRESERLRAQAAA